MANSPYTGVEHIEPNQSQKEVTANDGFDRLSNFVAETLGVTVSGNTSITEDEFQQAVRLDLGGAPGSGFDLDLPSAVKKIFVVNNDTGQTATVGVSGSAGATVNVSTGSQFLLYTDGTDVISLSSNSAGTLAGLSETNLSGAADGDALVRIGGTWVPVKLNVWAVLDQDVADPSTLTPSQDDTYIVASSAVGSWAGQDGNIAYYQNGVWEFVTATEGMLADIADEDTLYRYDGSSWAVVFSGTSTFTGLTDTPGSFTSLSLVRANSGGTALEFVPNPLDVGIFRRGQPGASETVATYVTARAFTLPSGLTNSQGYAGTAPADGDKDLDVQKNGASVGTVTFAVSTQTATFTMASATSFSVGDRLTIVAPGSQDSAMADVSITLRGTKD